MCDRMTDILIFRVDCVNKFDRNALSGYQASDLSEMGGYVMVYNSADR